MLMCRKTKHLGVNFRPKITEKIPGSFGAIKKSISKKFQSAEKKTKGKPFGFMYVQRNVKYTKALPCGLL